METMNSHSAIPPECALYIFDTHLQPLITDLHRAADDYDADSTIIDGNTALEHDQRPPHPVQLIYRLNQIQRYLNTCATRVRADLRAAVDSLQARPAWDR
jgi:hypothetical protein